ncbi:hypothetical protein TNCV_1210621 [Trichonephila clavipes]|nr:hypothetical protein TNCV_1210621 [Trichonephila clavipes]
MPQRVQVQSLKDSRSPFRNTPDTHFFHLKSFRASSCFGSRNRRSTGIIQQSYDNFSIRTSDSDTPSRNTPESKFSGSKTSKLNPCHGVSKIILPGKVTGIIGNRFEIQIPRLEIR